MFNLKVHHKNPKTGKLERVDKYQLIIDGHGRRFRRDGLDYYPNGERMDPRQKPIPQEGSQQEELSKELEKLKQLANQLAQEKEAMEKEREALKKEKELLEMSKLDREKDPAAEVVQANSEAANSVEPKSVSDFIDNDLGPQE